MHFIVFATHKPEMGQERLRLSAGFGDYVHDPSRHADVTVHHGGPTLGEDDETVNGLLLVLEAQSIEAVQKFVANSPYARAGVFAQSEIRAWNWLTGRPA